VPVPVVDRLELVQVEQQDRHTGRRGGQVLLEHGAVRQAGQRVVEREMLQPPGEPVPLGQRLVQFRDLAVDGGQQPGVVGEGGQLPDHHEHRAGAGARDGDPRLRDQAGRRLDTDHQGVGGGDRAVREQAVRAPPFRPYALRVPAGLQQLDARRGGQQHDDDGGAGQFPVQAPVLDQQRPRAADDPLQPAADEPGQAGPEGERRRRAEEQLDPGEHRHQERRRPDQHLQELAGAGRAAAGRDQGEVAAERGGGHHHGGRVQPEPQPFPAGGEAQRRGQQGPHHDTGAHQDGDRVTRPAQDRGHAVRVADDDRHLGQHAEGEAQPGEAHRAPHPAVRPGQSGRPDQAVPGDHQQHLDRAGDRPQDQQLHGPPARAGAEDRGADDAGDGQHQQHRVRAPPER
jgi:hypothetical protein